MSEMVTLWLVVLIVSIGVEVATLGLTSIWFAGGAAVAVMAAAFHGPIWLQILLFFAVSLLLLFFTRPVAVRYFNKDRVRTNVESMIGKNRVEPIHEGKVRTRGTQRTQTYAEGGKMIVLIIIAVLVLWIFVSCIKIVPQAQAYVIERLGAYQATWNVGFI